MFKPTSDIEARATAAAQIAEVAARETLAAVDLAMSHLDQGPAARPALLAAVTGKVGLALRAAGRESVDEYFELAGREGRSRRAAARELGEPMGLTRSGVAGSFSRRTDPKPRTA